VQHPLSNLFAEVRTSGRLASVAESIRREIGALDPAVPIRMETVADRIRESLVTERVIAILAATLGITALVLACAGLYGMLAYAVSRRTREIGLRLALGARRGHVLRSVLGDTLTLTGAGIVAGLFAALAAGRVAENLLFQVSPRDPLSLIAAAGIMFALAALAGFVPARRASRVDPVVALRTE
jgi:ABC-type antimicrobial peptide transport system permease subunit